MTLIGELIGEVDEDPFGTAETQRRNDEADVLCGGGCSHGQSIANLPKHGVKIIDGRWNLSGGILFFSVFYFGTVFTYFFARTINAACARLLAQS